eukprot:TRINITY_DN17597_c0_g3_i1.p1 TRINITY_DN17597_c0_g3~~TRINITY_DN17597_c0_g3_i1.p1  ORF type:complete len:157 (-),score=5.32 TRINITY_DN17597_c0_g3_i1:14-457(-)
MKKQRKGFDFLVYFFGFFFFFFFCHPHMCTEIIHLPFLYRYKIYIPIQFPSTKSYKIIKTKMTKVQKLKQFIDPKTLQKPALKQLKQKFYQDMFMFMNKKQTSESNDLYELQRHVLSTKSQFLIFSLIIVIQICQNFFDNSNFEQIF